MILRLGEFEAHFEVGPTRLTTRLVEGDYPNYSNLIPKGYPNRLVVGRDSLLEAVKRVRLMTRDATTPARLSLRPDGVELDGHHPRPRPGGRGRGRQVRGDRVHDRLQPAQLPGGGIEAIEGDELALEVQDAGKPATLRAIEDSDYLYLLMPVKVS